MDSMEVDSKQEAIALSFTNEYESITDSTTTMLSLVNISATKVCTEETRPDIDVMAVLDVSTSMKGEKLALMKQAVEFMVTQLTARDRMTVISYGTKVKTVQPFCYMTPENKAKLGMELEKVTADGQTNLSGGLFEAMQCAHEHADAQRVASVLVFTDGQANVGVTDANKVANSVTSLLKSIPTVSVFTFGFGEDHSGEDLQAIAEAGQGLYYFLEDIESIGEAFADCLGGLLSVVAQNIKLKLKGEGGLKIREVHNSKFALEEKDSGEEVEVSIGDLYSEEERQILLTLSLTHGAGTPALSAEVVFMDVLNGAVAKVGGKSVISRDKGKSPSTPLPPHVVRNRQLIDQHRNRLEVAKAIKNAKEEGLKGNVAGSRSILQAAKKKVMTSPSVAAPMCQQLIQDVDACDENLAELSQNCSASVYARGKGSKLMNMHMMKHAQQRSTNTDATYETCSKRKQKTFFKKK